MADLNTTYHPYIQSFDIAALKQETGFDLFPDDSEVKQNMVKFFNDLNQQIALQSTTATAVKVPYTGTTSADRLTWVKARIEAIYNRLDLIRGFVDGNKAQIIAAGGQPPTNPLATIGSVMSLIPFTAPVGAVASLIARITSSANGNAVYRAQKVQEATSAITGFASDVTQLQVIRQQLLTELQSTKTPTTTDPTNEAPNIRIDYLLYGGLAVALIAFLIWRKRRKRKRSKR